MQPASACATMRWGWWVPLAECAGGAAGLYGDANRDLPRLDSSLLLLLLAALNTDGGEYGTGVSYQFVTTSCFDTQHALAV